MTAFSKSTTRLLLTGILGLYCLGYCVARLSIFTGVEYYPEGKGAPRQSYVTKRNLEPGQGWEYKLFWPAIKLEESLSNGIHNLRRR